jgi:hypothetical protein
MSIGMTRYVKECLRPAGKVASSSRGGISVIMVCQARQVLLRRDGNNSRICYSSQIALRARV